MVGEIKRALEETKLPISAVPDTAAATASATATTTPAIQQIVDQGVDQGIEPKDVPLEAVESAHPIPTATSTATPTLPLSEAVPADAVASESIPRALPLGETAALKTLRWKVSDLFSERTITVRKIDISTIALEGFAVGAALAAVVMMALRPR